MSDTTIKKPLDPVEDHARELIARYLGVPVVQHDGTGGDSLPDLRINYSAEQHGLVEVVRDVEHYKTPKGTKGTKGTAPNRVQQATRLSRAGDMWAVPGLTRDWMAELTIAAMDIRAIKRVLPVLLDEAERRGENHLQALPWSEFDRTAFQLHQLGIRYVQSLGPAAGDAVVSLIAPNFGSWSGSLDHIPAWCAAVLDREADVSAKLAAADCAERHAFLVATTRGDLAVYRSLWIKGHPGFSGQLPALPTAAPLLPAGVDGVWVCGSERVIAWFPGTGWADVYLASQLP